MKMVLMYDFMHFLDPALLKMHFLESIYYFHAFPPLMNASLGLLVNLFGEWAPYGARMFFVLLGCVMTASLTALFAVLGLGKWLIIGLVSCFMISPPTLYFELFYFHTYPTAVLLTFLAVLLVKGVQKPSTGNWFFVFLTACLLCYLRSTMHLIWFVAVFAYILLIQRAHRKTIIKAFLFPFFLVVLLYGKNLVVFGFFGASSWLGNSLTRKTIQILPDSTVQTLITEGKISPLCSISIFSPPQAYAEYFDLTEKRGIPALDQLEKSTGGGNFNHWIFLELTKIHLQDGLFGLKYDIPAYLRSVLRTSIEHFLPTTTWHPRDAEGSPHLINRQILGQYEQSYNTIVHTWPVRGLGLYVILVTFCIGGFLYAVIRWFRDKAGVMEYLILFSGFNSLFILSVGSVFEYGEAERFRYSFEALLWITAMYGIISLVRQAQYLRNFRHNRKQILP
jgi:hypothetical protein